jgi:hypothetical protein
LPRHIFVIGSLLLLCVCRESVALEDIDVISRTFQGIGRSAWGAVEVELGGTTRTEEGAYQFCSRLTEAGAKVVCIYGWWLPEGTIYAAKNPDTIKAIRRWLDTSP